MGTPYEVSGAVHLQPGLVARLWHEGLRDQGAHGPLGALTPQVVDALAAGFADAAGWAVAAAGAFLLLGLVGALQVSRTLRHHPRHHSSHEAPRPA